MCYQWKNSWPHTPLCLYTVWSVFNLYLSQNRVIYAIFRETELNGHCFKQKQKGEVKAEIVILYLCTFLSKEIENHTPPPKKKMEEMVKAEKNCAWYNKSFLTICVYTCRCPELELWGWSVCLWPRGIWSVQGAPGPSHHGLSQGRQGRTPPMWLWTPGQAGIWPARRNWRVHRIDPCACG